jgi:hypothetical protein
LTADRLMTLKAVMVSQELLTLSLSFFPLTLSTNFFIDFLRLARVSRSLFNSSTDFCSFKNVSFDNSWCSKRRNTNGLSSSLAQNTSLEKVKNMIREKKFFHILETFQDNLSSKCFQQKNSSKNGSTFLKMLMVSEFLHLWENVSFTLQE